MDEIKEIRITFHQRGHLLAKKKNKNTWQAFNPVV
jgi:hypothetical protein